MEQYKFRKSAQSTVEDYSRLLEAIKAPGEDLPFYRIIRDELGRAVDCWRVVKYIDLGTTLVGWAALAITYRSDVSRSTASFLVEYSVSGKKKVYARHWQVPNN